MGTESTSAGGVGSREGRAGEPSADMAAGADEPRRAGATPRRSAEHFAVLGVAGLVVLGLLVLGLWLVPDPSGHGTHRQLGMPPCMLMEVWNVPCPGCGVTTSVTLMTHGRPLDSFLNQPFGFLIAVGLALFVLWSIWSHWTGRDLWVWLHTLRFGRWGIAVGAIAAASWAYKIWLVRHGAG